MVDEIRRRVLVEGSAEAADPARDGDALEDAGEDPGAQRAAGLPARATAAASRRWGRIVERIRQILEEDKAGAPKKQRHTAKRIFERLREEGYTGGYTQVKEAVRELAADEAGRCSCRWCIGPGRRRWISATRWSSERGAAQGGVLRDGAAVLGRDLRAGVRAECTETFWEGHVRAFEFFGGVPRRITYDNERGAGRAGSSAPTSGS